MAECGNRQIGILGGGPAGLSAALWLKNLGFAPWIAEPQNVPGGMQNLNFLANTWVLGQRDVTGPDLAARFADHVGASGVRTICGVRPISVEGAAGAFQLRLIDSCDRIHHEKCVALLIATGTRFRGTEVLQNIPGFASIPSQSIAYGPYAFADMPSQAGRRILILGGGDNAFENARLLLGLSATVWMVLRSLPRAQKTLRAAVQTGACRTLSSSRISSLVATKGGIEATLATPGGTVTVEVDRIHVLAGYEPNTAFLHEVFGAASAAFRLDDMRYLLTDGAGRTGMTGVYAAGDVCNPTFPSVVSAVGLGARAAKTIEMDLRDI